MNQHFLQSDAWEKFQHALGNTTVRRSGDGWSYLAIVEHGGGLTRLYCPYGPTVNSLESLDQALDSLKTEARKIGAAFLRLQPVGVSVDDSVAKPRKLKHITYSQPTATRIIDLTPPVDDIFARMSSSKRNVCKNYTKKGLSYHVSHDPADIELLLPCLHDIAVRNHISVHDDDYVRKQAQAMMPDFASLHYIELEGEVVTASLLYEGKDTNYYAHSGTREKHYKLQANTALIGELILYSKQQGKHYLDLYGVAPTDDPAHPWAGISNFKAEFGGEIVRYNQTYDIALKRLMYAAYSQLRAAKRRRG